MRLFSSFNFATTFTTFSTNQFIQEQFDPSTIALFRSKLPLEVRNMIWKYTLQPQIIEIQFTNKKAVYTTSRIPTALHVSKESRAAVEKFYPFCFRSVWHRCQTRFNFELDTIFLNGDYYTDFCHFFTLTGPIDLHQIRYPAIDNSCQYISENNETDEEDFERLKGVMEALEEMLTTYDAESCFKNCLRIGKEEGEIQIYDTVPVPEMIKEGDVD